VPTVSAHNLGQNSQKVEATLKPEDLTIEALESSVNLAAELWHGKCSELAWAAIELLGHGDYAYGHYLGYVDPKGYWGKYSPFSMRHGWALLEDGRILDPTRWSFENVEPYIYVGDAKDYDEGGTNCVACCEDPALQPTKVSP